MVLIVCARLLDTIQRLFIYFLLLFLSLPDSPCKTLEEITYALSKGVHVNANTLNEVTKIRDAITALEAAGVPVLGSAGLRINPLVGSGKIAALSTATTSSKFGVPLTPPGSDIGLSTEAVVGIFLENRFLNSVMCHVGSQGCGCACVSKCVRVRVRVL